ncbi:hypothetical protein EW146_g8305 [Bondarzewia mesenterica]|uniref:Peptidase S53 domain-containing protein n=1 Tax=Bondarzewia mesenterica TaxID=1095465 RepID=A0A4S4LG35_9AGAM|nr:hypothetical protein EW146_g8305 [Bondarzewia mesenterica]
MIKVISLISYFLTLASATPLSSRDLRVHEKRASPPSGFIKNDAAPAHEVLNLRFALVQSDFAGLEDALYAVSTPGNVQYRQHLSKEEVEKFIVPSAETVSSVNAWLSANGLTATPISPVGDWLAVNMTVQQANEILAADFTTYTQEETGQKTVRTLTYSIPASLKEHIIFVHPTVAFPVKAVGSPLKKSLVTIKPRPSSNLTDNAVPASCASEITPSCLQALYGIPTTKSTASSNRLTVSAFIEQYASTSDLELFLQQFRPDLSGTTFTLQTLDGGTNPQNNSGVEADLDTEYTIGIASGVPVDFLSIGSNNPDGIDGFLDEVNFLLSESPIPHVLTTSYSFNEPDLPASLATSLCNAYAQLGARGTSIFFSSGDGGVSGGQSQSCTTFVPTFPSTCPYITSVGGTTGVNPETGASLSSGGFSNYFSIPSYQASAVSSYLSTLGSTYSGLYNPSGRAFPDMSAMATSYVIAWGGEFWLVDGTSCSTPLFASIIALIDGELSDAGEGPLGFLNPLIYSSTSAFTDITSGDNPGCSTNGFSAGTGWDPTIDVSARDWSLSKCEFTVSQSFPRPAMEPDLPGRSSRSLSESFSLKKFRHSSCTSYPCVYLSSYSNRMKTAALNSLITGARHRAPFPQIPVPVNHSLSSFFPAFLILSPFPSQQTALFTTASNAGVVCDGIHQRSTSQAAMYHIQSFIRTAEYRRSLFASSLPFADSTNVSRNSGIPSARSKPPSNFKTWPKKVSPTVALSNASASPHSEPSINLIPFPSTDDDSDSFSHTSSPDLPSRQKRSLPPDGRRRRCQIPPSHSAHSSRRKTAALPARQRCSSEKSAGFRAKRSKHSKRAVADLQFTAAVHRSIVWRLKRQGDTVEKEQDVDMNADVTGELIEAQERQLVDRLWQHLVDQGCSPVLLDGAAESNPSGSMATEGTVDTGKDVTMDVVSADVLTDALLPMSVPAPTRTGTRRSVTYPGVFLPPPPSVPPPLPPHHDSPTLPDLSRSPPTSPVLVDITPTPPPSPTISPTLPAQPVVPPPPVYTMPQLVATLIMRHRDRAAVKSRGTPSPAGVRKMSSLAEGVTIIAEEVL